MDRCDQSSSTHERYVQETGCHMNVIVDELHAVAAGVSKGFDRLWQHLYEQEILSSEAGFSGIAGLCDQIRNCLKEAEQDHQTPLPLAAKAMTAVCRAIMLHSASLKQTERRNTTSSNLYEITVDSPVHYVVPPKHLSRRYVSSELE